MAVVGGRKEFCLELESVLETIMLWFMPNGIVHNYVLLMKLSFISVLGVLWEHESSPWQPASAWCSFPPGGMMLMEIIMCHSPSCNSSNWWHGEWIRNGGLHNVPFIRNLSKDHVDWAATTPFFVQYLVINGIPKYFCQGSSCFSLVLFSIF